MGDTEIEEEPDESDYNPNPATAAWLNWALAKAKSVPYKPTTRWLFYRLVQEKGFSKKDYKKFLKILSRARKSFFNGWAPDTIADDTRTGMNYYGTGFSSVTKWFESQARKSPLLKCERDQDNIVFVCYEAKAMTGQFRHYLDQWRVCLFPFGGDASVPYKYDIAQAIDQASNAWPEKKMVVLYFGDYDPKGLEIPDNAMRDIRAWCKAEIEFHRLGINEAHISKFNIPDNPDAPGKYQWEALEDKAAHELLDGIFKYWDKEVVEETRVREQKAGDIWNKAVKDAVAKAKKEFGDDEDDDEDGEEEDEDDDTDDG